MALFRKKRFSAQPIPVNCPSDDHTLVKFAFREDVVSRLRQPAGLSAELGKSDPW
jgi:hypothetical protein